MATADGFKMKNPSICNLP